ncbi:hypothetical protein Pan5_68 [Pseudanabaena phage Pan5]|nr:hypothetical protein Pan5_68 [Pseudanabaena phage Pan5]
MTPKEKATALYNKYYACVDFAGCNFSHQTAKQCALIAVDEILSELKYHSDAQPIYWNQVKTEIEKL